MDGKRCLVKKKTRTARRTLEPLYQQQLEFKVEFTGKTLQVNQLALTRLCSRVLFFLGTTRHRDSVTWGQRDMEIAWHGDSVTWGQRNMGTTWHWDNVTCGQRDMGTAWPNGHRLLYLKSGGPGFKFSILITSWSCDTAILSSTYLFHFQESWNLNFILQNVDKETTIIWHYCSIAVF